jgi:hypothetical protein
VKEAAVSVGNGPETMASVHHFLAVQFSVLFSRTNGKSQRGHDGDQKMGRRQTENYQSEAAYQKLVLFWLQGYWTGPAPTFYPHRKLE